MAKKEAKTNKKENTKNKKSFVKDFKAELKKVVWPTPKQLVNNTIAVITIVLITATIVFALDFTFETLNKYSVEKIKKVVTSTEENVAIDETIEEPVEEITGEVVENTTIETTDDVETNTEANSQ